MSGGSCRVSEGDCVVSEGDCGHVGCQVGAVERRCVVPGGGCSVNLSF